MLCLSWWEAFICSGFLVLGSKHLFCRGVSYNFVKGLEYPTSTLLYLFIYSLLIKKTSQQKKKT